jgi:hypothetical protein|tara:strand:- start:2022 stop:2618 length:597 start_codon:yes stop_codon:yes gene_type:complete
MRQLSVTSKYFLFLILVSILLFLWIGNSDQAKVIDEASSLLSTKSPSSGSYLPNGSAPLDPSPEIVGGEKTDAKVLQLNSAKDFRKLSIGTVFNILVESNGSKANVSLQVDGLVSSSNFTQITSAGIGGEFGILTFTDTSTNISIKTSTNIYEYSGTNFSGLVEQMGDLNLSDDIYIGKAGAELILKNSLPTALPVER